MASPMKSTVKYLDGMAFDATTGSGHKVQLDSSPDVGGSDRGSRPMELMLASLGGCTAMDVVSILVKMRQPLESFSVEVSGVRAEEHPKRFTSLEVVYRLKGDLDERKVERAIQLSEERYCSVEATLKPALPITSRYEIER